MELRVIDEPLRLLTALCLAAASFPRLVTGAAFPNGLARKRVGPNPVHRSLLRACLQEVVESLSRECRSDEQLSRPSLLNLTAKDDVDFRLRRRRSFAKEEPPRLLVLEAMEHEPMGFVPRQASAGKLPAFVLERDLVPNGETTPDFDHFCGI